MAKSAEKEWTSTYAWVSEKEKKEEMRIEESKPQVPLFILTAFMFIMSSCATNVIVVEFWTKKRRRKKNEEGSEEVLTQRRTEIKINLNKIW